MKDNRLNLRIPPELADKLRAYAARRCIHVSAAVVQLTALALAAETERQPKKG